MGYINKDILVAEIEKIIEELAPSHDQQCPWEDGYYCGLYKAESIIDTIETKEVNLEKECKTYLKNNFTSKEAPDEFLTTLMQLDDMVLFAKHFYELGLKARKEE